MGGSMITQVKELQKQNTSTDAISSRCRKAIDYFTTQMHDMIIIELEQHIKTWKRKSGARQYNNLTQEIIDDCWKYIDRLYHLKLKDAVIYEGERKFKQVEQRSFAIQMPLLSN